MLLGGMSQIQNTSLALKALPVSYGSLHTRMSLQRALGSCECKALQSQQLVPAHQSQMCFPALATNAGSITSKINSVKEFARLFLETVITAGSYSAGETSLRGHLHAL